MQPPISDPKVRLTIEGFARKVQLVFAKEFAE